MSSKGGVLSCDDCRFRAGCSIICTIGLGPCGGYDSKENKKLRQWLKRKPKKPKKQVYGWYAEEELQLW